MVESGIREICFFKFAQFLVYFFLGLGYVIRQIGSGLGLGLGFVVAHTFESIC